MDEAAAILDDSQYVAGTDAYLSWLQDRHDQAIAQLNGVHFDIAAPLTAIEVGVAFRKEASTVRTAGESGRP